MEYIINLIQKNYTKMKKPNKDIRILDTGVVCVETTDIKGNHKIETYTMKEYIALTNKRIKQQEKFDRFMRNSLIVCCMLLVFCLLLFLNGNTI